MKEIYLVYGDDCISSKKALFLLEKIIQEQSSIVVHKIAFSFDEPLVKKHKIQVTPTFILDDKIVFVGIPETKDLIKKIELSLSWHKTFYKFVIIL